MLFIYRRLGNPKSSGLRFEVGYLPALAVGGAAQLAAAHCLNERTLDPIVLLCFTLDKNNKENITANILAFCVHSYIEFAVLLAANIAMGHENLFIFLT